MGKKHKKHHRHDMETDEEREKPLKLVLKVGTPDTRENDSYDDTPDKKHKHKKKKKHKKYDQESSERKRKREHHSHDRIEEETPEVKKPAIEPLPEVKREISTEERLAALAQTLDYLHRTLQRKDMNGFFAFPVTDAIAPLYSTIIKNPMDFSTMRTKIDNNEYDTVLEFRNEFKMMCENALTYNHPDTIYYKEAKKLLGTGLKMMTKDKMAQLRRSLAFMADMTDAEMGKLEDEPVEDIIIDGEPLSSPTVTKKPKKPKPSKFEAIADRMSPEAILAQARAAAREAADSLTLRKPKTDYGFLRRKADGSTSLTVLNSDNDGRVSNKEKIVNLGQLIGRVQSGSGVLTGLREDKRNRANPVSYLNYGPFSTYAPVYDSTTANISKEESDMLLATYGDETAVEYCKSVRAFVHDSGDYALKMVDSLLDILTQGEHGRALAYVLEKERSQQQQLECDKKSGHIDFASLRTLGDLGIDVSFIDHFENQLCSSEPRTQTERIQRKLDETGVLINDLQKTQHQRLSQKLPPHLALVPGPSEKEAKLAEKVTKELAALAKQAQPQAVVATKSVRKAIGISDQAAPDASDEATETAQPISEQSKSVIAIKTDDTTDAQMPLETDTNDAQMPLVGAATSDGKSSSKDSVDRDLDAVLDELEMEGESDDAEESMDSQDLK